MLKKTLIYTAITLSALIVLITILAVTLLNWPTLVINPAFLVKARPWLSSWGMDVNWKNLAVTRKYYGFLHNEIRFNASDFCLVYRPSIENLCFKAADLRVRYRILPRPEIISLGPITLSEGRAVVVQTPSAFSLPELTIPDYLRRTSFYPIVISLDEIEIHQGDAIGKGHFILKAQPTEQHALDHVSITTRFENLNLAKEMEADLVLKSPENFRKDVWDISGKAKMTQQTGARIEAQIEGTKDLEKTIRGTVQGNYVEGKKEAKFDMTVHYLTDEIRATVEGHAKNFTEKVSEASFKDCHAFLKKKGGENDGELEVNCPVTIALAKLIPPVRRTSLYAIPKTAIVDLKLTADTFYFPDLTHPLKGTLKADLKPTAMGIVTTAGRLNASFEGTLADSQKMKKSGDAQITFTVTAFERIVDFLKNTPYAVWAPFNVLRGKADLKVNVKSEAFESFDINPITFETRLSSPKQNFDIDLKGYTRVTMVGGGARPETVKMDVTLSDIKLALPDLVPAYLPKITPDARFVTEPKKKRATSLPFKSLITIKTLPGQPVKVITNLTKAPIPLELDLVRENELMKGEVRVLSTALDLFHRDAKVEKIRLVLADPTNQSEINARLGVSYTDYAISIHILGTLERPEVIFESQPPLSQQDIISVLIFGEPYDGLGDSDSTSVGDMSAALADRALGLASLYLMASTPVSHVNYNPSTQAFSAKLRVAKGTSVTVGNKEGETQLGLRKNLGKGIIIRTVYETPNESSPARGSVFLEWHKRY